MLPFKTAKELIKFTYNNLKMVYVGWPIYYDWKILYFKIAKDMVHFNQNVL